MTPYCWIQVRLLSSGIQATVVVPATPPSQGGMLALGLHSAAPGKYPEGPTPGLFQC